jgi:hypothetical protein
MDRKTFVAQIDGNDWLFRDGNPGKKNHAKCEFKNKEVIFRASRMKWQRIFKRDLIHETIHAACPQLDEPTVEMLEKAIDDVLNEAERLLTENSPK